MIGRQRRCERNLVRSGVPLEEVQKIINGYLEKGYIRKLTKSEAEEIDAFYLPWFPVVDRSCDSTPVSLVFDAASKDTTRKRIKFKNINDFISWKSCGNETQVREDHWTKRLILHAAASVFDPLGLISPFTACAKVILQQIWKLVKVWMHWLEDVFETLALKISPRTGFRSDLQIHIFCKFSEKDFSNTVYSHDETSSGAKTLLTSKSRLPPQNLAESISRLEHFACGIGVRLWSVIHQTYPTSPSNTFFWACSQACLHWLNITAKLFKVFVNHIVRSTLGNDPSATKTSILGNEPKEEQIV